MASAPLLFEPNAVYVLLLDRGETYNFHWEIYLASTATHGTIFYITNDSTPTKWEHKREFTSAMPQQQRLILALRVGTVEPLLHSAMADRLALIPTTLPSTRFREPMTSRVWVKEALFLLDNEGYLNLGAGPTDVEAEAKHFGMLGKSKNERRVLRSKAYVA